MTRRVEASVWEISWPFSIILTARDRIWEGAGRNRGSMNPSRQISSQVVMKITREAILTARDLDGVLISIR